MILFDLIHKLESSMRKPTSSHLKRTNVCWRLPQKAENECRKLEVIDMEFWNMHLESMIHSYYGSDSMPNTENWADLVCWSRIFSLR